MDDDKLIELITKHKLGYDGFFAFRGYAFVATNDIIAFAREVERFTMIRCVNLVEKEANRYYEKMSRLIEPDDEEELNDLKAACFNRQAGAHLILEELGMTFPECRQYAESDGLD